jgi:spore coat protein CotH
MKPNVLIRLLASTAIGAWLLLAHPAIAAAQSPDDLFDPDTLQEIRLTINSRDLHSLHDNFMDNTYYTADLQWRDVRVRNAGVKSRGGASRNGSKLHLRVDFNRYVNGQKFLGLKSIVLKNLWQDSSMMHERLAMAFFTRMGQPAPRQSFCRLYINNQYQGLYAIVESVDNGFLDRTLGEHAGYLYSYELQDTFYATYLGEELEPYRLRFEAQNHEKEGDSKLYLPIHDLFKEVNEPDDAIWRERVEQYIDLPQFITHVAIEAFLAENDGLLGQHGMNNFFFYRLPGTTRHRFLPWDKDNAFLVIEYSIFQWSYDNILFRRAFAYPDLRELYYQVLESAARSAAEDDWLRREIEKAAAQIASAVEDDALRPFSTEDFYKSVEMLKEFAKVRSKLVLEQVKEDRKRR